MTTPRKPPLRIKCELCGKSVAARSTRQRFCSATCQKRARRAPTPARDSDLVKSVRADLRKAKKLDTWAGQAALTIAAQIVPGAAGVASLMSRLEQLMDRALGPVAKPAPTTPIEKPAEKDEIALAREARAKRRAAAG